MSYPLSCMLLSVPAYLSNGLCLHKMYSGKFHIGLPSVGWMWENVFMKTASLNRNQIKYLVILAMVIDHVAWRFVSFDSWQGQLMHFIGRLTGPAMAFFIAEGFIHTRNLKKYLIRMGIFALVSWIPFSLYFHVRSPLGINFGIIYTLFLGLFACYFDQKADLQPVKRRLAVCACMLLSIWGDWPGYGVIMPLLLVRNYHDKSRMWRAYFEMTIIYTVLLGIFELLGGGPARTEIYLLGVLLPLFLIRYSYNGQAGSRKSFHKWFFYAFYPGHLLVLYGISRLLGY